MRWPQESSEQPTLSQEQCARLFLFAWTSAYHQQPMQPVHKLREVELEAEHLKGLIPYGLPTLQLKQAICFNYNVLIHDM